MRHACYCHAHATLPRPAFVPAASHRRTPCLRARGGSSPTRRRRNPGATVGRRKPWAPGRCGGSAGVWKRALCTTRNGGRCRVSRSNNPGVRCSIQPSQRNATLRRLRSYANCSTALLMNLRSEILRKVRSCSSELLTRKIRDENVFRCYSSSRCDDVIKTFCGNIDSRNCRFDQNFRCLSICVDYCAFFVYK